jgi:hypothetical protein
MIQRLRKKRARAKAKQDQEEKSDPRTSHFQVAEKPEGSDEWMCFNRHFSELWDGGQSTERLWAAA